MKLSNVNALSQDTWEVWGLSLPAAQRERLVQSWVRVRALGALVFVVAALVLWFVWRWHALLPVAGLALVSVLDAFARIRRRAFANPWVSVLLDITVIYVCMGVASVPDSAYGIAYVYMVLSALLLLEPMAATTSILYASGWFPLIVNLWPAAEATASVAEIITAGAITDFVLGLGSLGLLMVTMRIANRERRRRAHRARMQTAIAQASNALLTGRGDDPIESSLRALLHATAADSVFIEMNIDDPKLGLCSSMAVEVHQDGSVPDPADLWQRVPWSVLSGRTALENGQSHVVRFSELGDEERMLYAQSDIRSELNIPIFVNGTWWGLIGFDATDENRVWPDSDNVVLSTAAEMIGAYLERAAAQNEMQRMIDDLDLQLRYQQGLSECAAALQSPDEAEALQVALESLRMATQTDYAYIEEQQSGTTDGATITHLCGDADTIPATGLTPAGDRGHGASSTAGKKWELRLPIEAQDDRRGSIVFSDRTDDRAWSRHEVQALQTAAQMVGAYWDRAAAAADLEELVRSKDEFVAAVSHELRTPLTSVVGRAAELRDRRGEFTDAEAQELISIIAGESTEVANIVNDLLIVARAEIDTLFLAQKPLDICDAVQEVVSEGRHRGGVEVTGTDARVYGDPLRIRQILRNLVSNAARHGGENVRLEVAVDGSMASIVVADDGRGVEEHDKDVIFDPYVSAHRVATQPASVGLGLAVARQLARLMGGDLVYERENGWTRFVLTLPLANDAVRRHVAGPPVSSTLLSVALSEHRG